MATDQSLCKTPNALRLKENCKCSTIFLERVELGENSKVHLRKGWVRRPTT
jgi:hypothetical protein